MRLRPPPRPITVKRTALALPLLLAGLAGLAGCGSDTAAASDSGAGSGAGSDGTTVGVVASTDVWGDVARQIGGDAVSVTSIIDDPTQDPHSFEADAGTLLSVRKAGLVIENGGGYDDFMDTVLESSGSSATVLNAVEVSGQQAPAGGELNEHVWYDVPTVALMAQRIADELSTLDPDDATTFAANATTFVASLTALERREQSLRGSLDGETIAITEPVPLYLTEAVGLENRTPAAFSEAVEEGDDVSASVLSQTLDLFSGADPVGALVYNEQTSGPVTTQVLEAARAAGVPVVPVTETLPAGQDYQTWMGANLTHLEQALS